MRQFPPTARVPHGNPFHPILEPLCELIAQLERSIMEAGEPADAACGGLAGLAPRQQALLSSFALLLARIDPRWGGADEEGFAVAGAPDGAPACARRALVGLQRMRWRDSAAARAMESFCRLLKTPRVQRIVRQIDARETYEQDLVHLFELLLARSDRSVRRSRGVYFTPYPLVQYIVRSIDLLLRNELAVAEGLISRRPPLRIVDPACGSGAFLLGVLRHAERVLRNEGKESDWPRFAQETLLPSLTGIDIMPACCGAAEMLVQRLLAGPAATARGPAPGGEHPLGAAWSARCGNPLGGVGDARTLFAGRVPVILGNPPYAIFGQRNRGEWILRQLEDYKRGLNEKKLNLDDDFIKFLRWAQYWIDEAGRGIVAMVTNNTYLAGLTHRQMRASLSDTFDQVYVLDLHGSSKRRETTPDGGSDENVFPIQQGVAIGLFIKTGPRGVKTRRVVHADLWGPREGKLKALANADVTTLDWIECRPHGPFHFFVPRGEVDGDGYCDWPQLNEIFPRYISGVQTKCDALFVGHTWEEVETRMSRFLGDAAVERFAGDVPLWLRKKASRAAFDPGCIRPYMIAPMDVRWVYYEPRLLGRARIQLTRQWDAGSIALVFMRQATDRDCYDHFLVTESLISDRVFYSAHGAPFVAPLHVRDGANRVANLQPRFLQSLAQRLGIPLTAADEGLPTCFGARDVLHWLYAAVHSREYRRRYHSLLCTDFPRVAWPHDGAQFARLCRLGKTLVEAQLGALAAHGNRPSGAEAYDRPSGGVPIEAGFPLWQEGRLTLNRQFIWPDPIEADVWRFRVGGYHVLERWLKQRRQRLLIPSDLDHLEKMIRAIRSTSRIMDEIDLVSTGAR